MFKKVLIANRGVIACRIIRTLKKLGVQSVAVYSEADQDSLHVQLADEAYCVGGGPASQSYLLADKILEVAQFSGAEAIHPGYGFLSENPEFAQACEDAGIAFIGPTADQMRAFGLKHKAREIALAQGAPLLPGTELLSSPEEALQEARRIGFPVMLKSTAGGGGIGMRLIWTEDELHDAYSNVVRLAQANFKDSGIYLEKYVEHARHIEVQLFGDGKGHMIALGERDCSVQRRNQKVIEETPAPNLTPSQREGLFEAALRLGRAVNYRSAGTVEFVLDSKTGEYYFLEVNTRLQVEHGVTEEVTGVDLVAWMVQLAAGDLPELVAPEPSGASVQVRLYAEDPAKNFQPCAGLLTEVQFPEDVRGETWVKTGSNVPAFYDPMIGKLIVHAETREAAIEKLSAAMGQTRLMGIETNLDYLQAIVKDEVFLEGHQTTRYLNTFTYQSRGIEVLDGGVQTTVQDDPGRLGYWDVGIPPSGPMDNYAFRMANRLLGNAETAAGLECTVAGPTLKFRSETTLALTGAPVKATLDGWDVPMWEAVQVPSGSTLTVGSVQSGCRTYIAFAGGLDVPHYLGSQSTFTLGQFGGHAGRTLRVGDVINLLQPGQLETLQKAPSSLIPEYTGEWEIGVMYGPHGAPDFFTDSDIKTFFEASWEVHYNSSRTGVRLIGPRPEWARQDGGEAGLHPSNIHDNAYAIGAVDFTGDMPVILGPDGPSLGGFVCPVTIVEAELWKIGQLRPGDRIRFVPIGHEAGRARQTALQQSIKSLSGTIDPPLIEQELGSPMLQTLPEREDAPAVVYRQAGDRYLLIEYGPLMLDLNLRFRVHALMTALQERQLEGIVDLTPGIRSLQVHFDPAVMDRAKLLEVLRETEGLLPDIDHMEVPSRTVHLPLSWDDPATKLAIEKYMQSVRPDAPWCPSNIEFIRRINGLESIEEVKKIVFEASYLVLGLGDVYLGAPVATPMDPRHRLVTTKYNPARTWTPENAVGIGGAYMCVYGMEGPGGYQFVGRTVQMWNKYHQTRDFQKPWLLRFFDQIRFFEVSEQELLDMRSDFLSGRYQLRIEEGKLNLREYNAFLQQEAASIAAFKTTQQASFEAERERWRAAGLHEYISETASGSYTSPDELDLPEHSKVVASPVSGSMWEVRVKEGQQVQAGDTLFVVESMKTEFAVQTPVDGVVHFVGSQSGQAVTAGQQVIVLNTALEEQHA
ncbi:urea carboxylase [Deinococcus cellulosilyticus]|uniref:Urea carboxylase n=1 Tax=Deinococcus cellulosilyticus (strain DSM 18568 / NBRC 106333 / KACC 11606 / 5516J-15) TaxID=1223518 RepID=A0A511MW41_DEIC1|nr:urea carboxylase [Deinococcus cellulosilyticus]GEM44770.1 urea carboxylase [Deinococcus cellulosilyticus NBRC 106333 = KACC 11606]